MANRSFLGFSFCLVYHHHQLTSRQYLASRFEILPTQTCPNPHDFELIIDYGWKIRSNLFHIPPNPLPIIVTNCMTRDLQDTSGKLIDMCRPSCTINKVRRNDYCTRRGVPKRMAYSHIKERARNS